MKQISRMAVPLIGCFVLSGCIGEGLCESYREIPEPDRNEDGKADYRYQVIGDSILAYNQFSCMSVGHYLGFNVNDRVQTRAITGAMLQLREITKYFADRAIFSGIDYFLRFYKKVAGEEAPAGPEA